MENNLKQKGNAETTETSTSAYGGKVRLNGVTWPWMVTQDALDTLKDYDILEDDVWITTYPKAGSHWVNEIVNLILVDGHGDQVSQQLGPVEFDFNQVGRSFFGITPPPARYKVMKESKGPRTIRTQLTEELMPTQIYQGRGKVIYIIRNPKDTAVSYWNFIKTMGFDSRYEDWDYFVRQTFNDETMVNGSWCTHVLGFWRKHRCDKNFLFLKYEDIKQDTKGAVIQIADFMGKVLSDDAIDRVVKFCSLENMRARYKKTMEKYPPWIRRGTVGDWKTVFTVEQNEAFDLIYQENMAGSGLTVQFE